MVDPALTARFAELVARPEGTVPLDEATLLVAAHDHAVDVDATLARLDALAQRCEPGSLDSVVEVLFEDEGLGGDLDDYEHPDNSFLDLVLERRQGLPILLSILTAEVGARAGVCLAPIGMPGHFLLRECAADGAFLDPFNRGRRLDRDGCEELFRRLHPGTPFQESFLDPVDARSVLARVLANLVRAYTTRGPLPSLAWSLELRAVVVGGDAWVHVGRVKERLGDWLGAASAWDRLPGDDATARAALLRARVN